MGLLNVIPNIMFDHLDEFLLEFEQHDKEVSSGVMVVGDAAAYAEVWEWGNTRQTKQGPRTVLGPNPDGDIVWLSSQAPEGWIRVNEDQIWAGLERELEKAQFAQPDARAMTVELEARAEAAAERAREILVVHAPKDSGQLAESLQMVPAGSSILDDSDDVEALELIGGEL